MSEHIVVHETEPDPAWEYIQTIGFINAVFDRADRQDSVDRIRLVSPETRRHTGNLEVLAGFCELDLPAADQPSRYGTLLVRWTLPEGTPRAAGLASNLRAPIRAYDLQPSDAWVAGLPTGRLAADRAVQYQLGRTLFTAGASAHAAALLRHDRRTMGRWWRSLESAGLDEVSG